MPNSFLRAGAMLSVREDFFALSWAAEATNGKRGGLSVLFEEFCVGVGVRRGIESALSGGSASPASASAPAVWPEAPALASGSLVSSAPVFGGIRTRVFGIRPGFDAIRSVPRGSGRSIPHGSGRSVPRGTDGTRIPREEPFRASGHLRKPRHRRGAHDTRAARRLSRAGSRWGGHHHHGVRERLGRRQARIGHDGHL